MNPGVAVRVAVIKELVSLSDGNGKSQDSLDRIIRKNRLNDADRGLATKLLYGSLRYAPGLFELVDAKLSRGIEKTDDRIIWTLVVAEYQLRLLKRTPPHAVVSTAVDAARKLAGNKAAKVVNAILRSELRESDAESMPAPASEECYGAMAQHAMDALGKVKKTQAQEGFLMDAPHVLRGRGELFGDSQALINYLEELGHTDMIPGRVKGSVIMASGKARLNRSIKQTELKWLPQDEASQAIAAVAAELAQSVSDTPKILDACAGRGVKTDYLHWALDGKASISACDVAESKLQKAKELIPSLSTQKADLGSKEPNLSGSYDFVLVDAPCTGFGTMRRRPEIRLDTREPNLYGLMNLQGRILQNVAAHVAPGGILLYVICSFTREEGRDNIERFLKSEAGKEFEQVPMPAPPVPSWVAPNDSWCTFDGDEVEKNRADVFYAAAFKKKV